MAKEKDPAEIIETIARSIRVSQRGARKVKAHRFKELFGYQVLNAARRERIEQLMAEAGIELRPSLSEAKRDDWLVMSMPVPVPVPEVSPDPAPTADWFAHMASVQADTEREVEMHFASPLFREGLGYREDQEAAGFGIRWARGNTPGHVEADLLYFATDKHDLKTGEPLVLVECKRLIKDEKELQGRGRSAPGQSQSAGGDSVGRRAPGARPLWPADQLQGLASRRAPESTAAKYRNQHGNQQTSVDVNGNTTNVRAGVFKRRFGYVN